MKRNNDDLESRMMRMTEFYKVEDIMEFESAIQRYGWREDDAYEFLDEFTRDDYIITESPPDINLYINLYAYRNGDKYD